MDRHLLRFLFEGHRSGSLSKHCVTTPRGTAKRRRDARAGPGDLDRPDTDCPNLPNYRRRSGTEMLWLSAMSVTWPSRIAATFKTVPSTLT